MGSFLECFDLLVGRDSKNIQNINEEVIRPKLWDLEAWGGWYAHGYRSIGYSSYIKTYHYVTRILWQNA